MAWRQAVYEVEIFKIYIDKWVKHLIDAKFSFCMSTTSEIAQAVKEFGIHNAFLLLGSLGFLLSIYAQGNRLHRTELTNPATRY
jgi:hypothetical protein